ncbi:unnamed protein product [Prunus armeniaca]
MRLRPARIATCIEGVSPRLARNVAGTCEGCCSDGSGISEACKDCDPPCEDGVDGVSGIDGSGMGVGTYGKCPIYRGDSTEFSTEVALEFLGILGRRAFW